MTQPRHEGKQRDASLQLADIVLYASAFVIVSAVVCILVALNAGAFSGILAGGITLVGLTLLSLIGWLYYAHHGTPLAVATALVTALATLAVSAVVGTLVALEVGISTGVIASGITLIGLMLLSSIGVLHYTLKRLTKLASLCMALVVVVSMIGAYTLLTRDYSTTTRRLPYVATPHRSVYFLIEDGQYYTGRSGIDDPKTEEAFDRFTCPAARKQIATQFASLVKDGTQHLTSDGLRVTEVGSQGDGETATVTATITIMDDLDGRVIASPETWTFHLEKPPGDKYWRVCRIDQPT